MRVLEAFGEPISYGGQETFVMNVLRSMDRTGIDVDLLSPYYCDNLNIAEEIRDMGGEVYSLGCPFRPGHLRGSAAGPVRDFLSAHRYDVIHIHSGSNSMLAMLSTLASRSGIPRIIVHSHCTGRIGIRHFASKTLTAVVLSRYPHAYLACSREAGEWRFPRRICRNELIIINNGIDVASFAYDEQKRAEMRQELGLDNNSILVGCVGRLTYQKNQGFLLDVLKAVRDRNTGEKDYKLILIGDGEDRRELESRTHKMGLQSHVIFTGAVDNVNDYLQAVDIGAMPSRYEGLAIAVIEEQAAGLEILASTAIPESAAVTGGVMFLPEGNVDMWAKVILDDHSRHPEQAEQVALHGYGIRDTASMIRKIYFDSADML